jgi:hypothetical protein
MADASDSVAVDSIDLFEFLRYLRKRLTWIVGAAILGILLALAYLNFATPRYSAELRVSSASGGSGLGGALGQLGGIAAMAGLDLQRGSGVGASPFDLYLDKLRSRANAEILAKDQTIMRHIFAGYWNAEENRWQEPRSVVRSASQIIRQLAGQPRPAWHPPGAAELAEFLGRAVRVSAAKPKEPPLTTLYYEDRDPRFAAMLLDRMHASADEAVRRHVLQRATLYSQYLTNQLAVTENADQRRNLSEILLEQQRAIMMASSSVAFAANPSEPAVASAQPVGPKVPTTLATGALVGALVGAIVVFLMFLMRGSQERIV